MNRLSTLIPGRPLRITLITIAVLIALLAVFHMGILAGYRKAAFSYRWGENYHRNFGGPRMGMFSDWGRRGFGMDNDFLEASGSVGQVMKVELPRIIVRGRNDVERVILTTDDTTIKRMRETVSAKDIQINDLIVTIGDPNDAGQTVAKLIRLLPFPPLPSGSGGMLKGHKAPRFFPY